MEQKKRVPRQYTNQNKHNSYHLTENANNYHSQPHKSNVYRSQSHHNIHSSLNNDQTKKRDSRKRRFEEYDDNHSNGTTFKRPRHNNYNYHHHHHNMRSTYNHNNYRANHNPQNPKQTQLNTLNETTKFRQQNYVHNNNYINNRNGAHKRAPKKKEMEQDFHRITQRMRQIDIGKATEEYKKYIATIPKTERKSHHPRTPNPRYKMPNRHWKTALNRWRKALHGFDHIHKEDNDKENKETQKCAEQIDDNICKFCCEKCSQEFAKFDEWQNHRQKCDGKKKIKEEDNEDEDEDDDIDLFKLDQDIDFSFMESSHNNQEEMKESSLLLALNEVLNEDDD